MNRINLVARDGGNPIVNHFQCMLDILPFAFRENLAKSRIFRLIRSVSVVVWAVYCLHSLISTSCLNLLNSFMSEVQLEYFDQLNDAFLSWFRQNASWGCYGSLYQAASAAYFRRNNFSKELENGDKLLYVRKGTHWFVHKFRIFKLVNMNDDTITLLTFGPSTKPIRDLLQEAWSQYEHEELPKITTVYHFRMNRWCFIANKSIRPLSTIDIADSSKDFLVQDIKTFLSEEAQEWHKSSGIPYKRGYLFYGPPGTGKTSATLAIAGEFQMEISVLSLADPNLNDTKLIWLFARLQKPSILLLEDIDSAGLEREKATTVVSIKANNAEKKPKDDDAEAENSGITLAGLLNALDGVAAPEGCIIIMTTNNPENLDPALVRPGRVDHKIEFGLVTREVAMKTFCRMLRTKSPLPISQQAEEFADMIPEGKISPAELQGYILGCRGDASIASRGIEAWIKGKLEKGCTE